MEKKIGQMLMVGFHGAKPEDPWPLRLRRQIENGLVGGVLLFRHNIESPDQASALIQALDAAPDERPLLVAVDQEGGRVQRLGSNNGFSDHSSAKTVARTMTPSEAETHYRSMAEMTAAAGFNLVLGPVADLDGPDPSPVIGGLERSYGRDPAKVADYAAAFVDAMRANHVISCLKHFPGHGRARGDTHAGLVDVTATWTEEELAPFRLLIERGKADMIMSAHILNRRLDPDRAATLSPAALDGLLRKGLGYDGTVCTDDLHMGAIQLNYGFEESVIQAVAAGADMLVFSNNVLAAKGVPGFEPDPGLPEKAIAILLKAVREGRVAKERILESCGRIARLKASRLEKP